MDYEIEIDKHTKRYKNITEIATVHIKFNSDHGEVAPLKPPADVKEYSMASTAYNVANGDKYQWSGPETLTEDGKPSNYPTGHWIKQPSGGGGGGGGGDVTKEYVDNRDSEVLTSAKAYADTKAKKLKAGKNITITETDTEYTISAKDGAGEPDKYLKTINVNTSTDGKEVTITDKENHATSFFIPNPEDSGWKYIDSLIRLDEYLYHIELKGNDYDYANKYFASHEDEVSAGSCTTISRDGMFARNFDWLYDNEMEFVIKTPFRSGVNRASIGTVAGFPKMTKQYIEAGKYDDDIRVIPFFTTDGSNDSGVTVSTHVLNNAYGDNKVINPTGDVKESMYSLMLPRYILDTFTSATAAVNYITENVKVTTPKGLLSQGYVQQFVIADATDTYTLEPFDGAYRLTHNKTAIITNFAWYSTTPTEGILWTNADIDDGKDPGSQTGYQHKASGVERYNFAFNLIKDSPDLDLAKCKDTLKKLNYTRLYDTHPNPPAKAWLSDYITTASSLDACASHKEAFDDDRLAAANAYSNRSRETAETWQTVHSVIYDIAARTMYITTQEQDNWMSFIVPQGGGDFATKTYVDTQDSNTLVSAKDYTNASVATKQDTLTAGENITITKSGDKTIISSTGGSGGDVTKEYVDEQDAEMLNTAKTYAEGKANDAKVEAKSYTDSEFIKLQGRIKTLEDWMASIKYEDLQYNLDGSSVTLSHLVDKSSTTEESNGKDSK